VLRSQQHFEFSRSQPISQQILPEATTIQASTHLLVDTQTGLVVRHEDRWENKASAWPLWVGRNLWNA